MVVAAVALSIAMTGRAAQLSAPGEATPEGHGARHSRVKGETCRPSSRSSSRICSRAAEIGERHRRGKLAASAELRELLAHLGQLRDAGTR